MFSCHLQHRAVSLKLPAGWTKQREDQEAALRSLEEEILPEEVESGGSTPYPTWHWGNFRKRPELSGQVNFFVLLVWTGANVSYLEFD